MLESRLQSRAYGRRQVQWLAEAGLAAEKETLAKCDTASFRRSKFKIRIIQHGDYLITTHPIAGKKLEVS